VNGVVCFIYGGSGTYKKKYMQKSHSSKDKKLPKVGAMRYGHRSTVGNNQRFIKQLEKSGFFDTSIAWLRKTFMKGGGGNS